MARVHESQAEELFPFCTDDQCSAVYLNTRTDEPLPNTPQGCWEKVVVKTDGKIEIIYMSSSSTKNISSIVTLERLIELLKKPDKDNNKNEIQKE